LDIDHISSSKIEKIDGIAKWSFGDWGNRGKKIGVGVMADWRVG
jgi:hypothetical protein